MSAFPPLFFPLQHILFPPSANPLTCTSIVFLHSIEATSLTFSHLFSLQTNQTDLFPRCPCYAIDLPGFNGTPLVPNVMESLNEFLQQTITTEKVIVVGHGLGGYLAILLAAKIAQQLDDIEMMPDPKKREEAKKAHLSGTTLKHTLVVDMDVTERKKVNKTLAGASEQHYYDYFLSTTAGVDAIELLGELGRRTRGREESESKATRAVRRRMTASNDL